MNYVEDRSYCTATRRIRCKREADEREGRDIAVGGSTRFGPKRTAASKIGEGVGIYGPGIVLHGHVFGEHSKQGMALG